MSNHEEKENLSLSKSKIWDFFKAKKKISNHLEKSDPQPVATSTDFIQPVETSNETIDHFLSGNPRVAGLQRQGPGAWSFQYNQINAHIRTDDRKGVNRMRIMSLISDDPNVFGMVEPERLLRANCHEALDARYCLENDGSLWTAFIHPLSTLAIADLESGLEQVTYLSANFPDDFSSLGLVFRGG